MASPYGLTSLGFVKKPPDVIQSEIDSDLQGILGASAGTNPDGTIPVDSMAGQLKTMLVDTTQAQWDLLQAQSAATSRAQASGAALDVVGALTGSLRDAQSFSAALCAMSGLSPAVLSAGRAAVTTATSSRFDLKTGVTLGSVAGWFALGPYSTVGTLVVNGGSVYVVVIPGTAGNSGGPTGTGVNIVDGSVTWAYVGLGNFGAIGTFQAEVAGPIGALLGDLATIASPVNNWTGIVNYEDASVGALTEADPAFRLRQDEELAGAGSSSADAIRSAILAVNQGSNDPNHQAPTSCTVFFNNSDATDANGLPPHSVEVMVVGGTALDIAEAIWKNVAAGTATHGNTTSLIVDSQGNTQVINWTIPTPVLIYVSAIVDYSLAAVAAGTTAANVAAAAVSAILTYGLSYPPGTQVRSTPLIGAAMFGPSQLDDNGNPVAPAAAGSPPVVGLLEVPQMFIGSSPSPGSSTTVPIGTRQFALFESVNIAVVANAESP